MGHGVRHPGCRPRCRVTRVTAQQQRRLVRAIKTASEMALLPYSTSAR
nr:hypothetical protein HEP84_51595 [Streptomyces sp. RLB1-33]